MPEIAGPLVGLIGVVVGAAVTYYATVRAEQRKEHRASRANAYSDFIRGVTSVKFAANTQSRGGPIGLALVADANARIAIYGSTAVVHALAEFWRLGGSLVSPEQMRAFLKAWQTMRRESLQGERPLPDSDASQLLFGRDL